jgi:hypothetical protein
MNCIVISFASKQTKSKPKSNAIEIQFDLGQWAVAYFHGSRFISRLRFESKADAEAEAIRLTHTGMTWRCGTNGEVYLFPDSTDGGCWAVAHSSRFGDSDAVLARHFALYDAVDDAIRRARAIGAEINAGIQTNEGGSA